MDEAWIHRVKALRHRSTDAEDTEYRALVYRAKGRCDYPTAKALLSTFTDADDYGVQESVVTVLASAEPQIYLRALFEEVPRLVREAPEWADVLVGREVVHEPEAVISVASTLDASSRQSFAEVVAGNADLLAREPNANAVLRALLAM